MPQQGKTLWERTKDWWKRNFGTPDPPPPVPEEEVFNPYKARVGSTVLTIDVLGLREYTFKVTEIREHKLDYGAKKFHFTDYLCQSTLGSGDPVEVIVRVYVSEMKGREHQVLVLKHWDTVAYDPDFRAMLDDDRFDTTVDDKIEASFWRINDVKTPYKVRVTTVAKNGDATTKDSQEAHFWDWWRDAKDEGGTEFKEFFFVNWDEDGKDDGAADKNTGNFEIWRGEEVIPSRVSLLRA